MSQQKKVPDASAKQKIQPPKTPDLAVEKIEESKNLAMLTSDLTGATGDEQVKSHASTLNDTRIPAVQRQKMAAEISRTAGNKYLQRVMQQQGALKNANKGMIKGSVSQRQHGVQAVPDVQRVGPAAPIIWAGMTASELISAGASISGVALAGGAVAGASKNTLGMAETLTLDFEGDFYLGKQSKSTLTTIIRSLFFIEMDKLHALNPGDSEEDLRGTAVGNVNSIVLATLLDKSQETTMSAVANGDGGRSKSYQPWGEALITMNHGLAYTSDFDPLVYGTAKKHGLVMDNIRVSFIESFTVAWDYEANTSIFGDDFIYVRGQDLKPFEDDKGRLRLRLTVAFDWDDDTTYLLWWPEHGNAINSTTGNISSFPKWQGPSDPDD